MLERENRLRTIARSLGEADQSALYALFSETDPALTPAKISVDDHNALVSQQGETFMIPRPVPLIILSHIVFGYETWLQRKYELPNFVSVEPHDIVVDCGAYVGGFSMSASRIAEQVHVFEPEAKNFAATKANLRARPNVTCVQAGLFDSSTEIELNVSDVGVEHSFLQPDFGSVVRTEKVKVWALKDYCKKAGIDALDFVKVEAEGLEPEVVAGLGSLRPKKLAIDVSEERGGESPAAEIQVILQSWGYECRKRDHVLFAKLNRT